MKIRGSKDSDIINIEYKSLNSELVKAHKRDSGYDILANTLQELTIAPGEYKTIDTGIHLQLPQSVEAQIRSRSGLASKVGVVVLNSLGTIDPGYRGEIKVVLINYGNSDYKVKPGDLIAQMVFAWLPNTEVIKVTNFDEKITERNTKGFGSTETTGTAQKKKQPA
jgi:dUTP pyrophosphatase